MIARRPMLAVVGAVAAALVVSLAPSAAEAAPAPSTPSSTPSNPSDQQIAQAQKTKADRAKLVGTLKAEIAQASGDITRLNDEAEFAGEQYNKAVVDYTAAQGKVAQTEQAQKQAQAEVAEARQAVGEFARGSFMYGSTLGSSFSLLDASGPTDFIERAGLLQAASEHQNKSLDAVQVATVTKANADAAARQALTEQTKAKEAAEAAKKTAEAKVTAARAQLAQLQTHKTDLEGQLVQAEAELTGLMTARQAYEKWQKEQEEIARQKAEAERQAKIKAAQLAAEAKKKAEEAKKAAEAAAAKKAADAKRAADAAAAKAKQEQQARAAAQQNSQSSNSGSSGNSDNSGSSGNSGTTETVSQPSPPPSNGWTAAKGRQVVQIAEQWLGTPYAWGGGTPSGPSMGLPPDVGVLGFDCSGLALYSWAQVGVSLPHYSGYQYNSGSHPSMNSLMPGDLLFWSYDGTPSSIHHVAIYIGNGRVIEAPDSGDVVKIVPIWYDGLVGATRPGT